MATRRVIKSVLRNFLGTYTSRYSEVRGYWLFGFLVSDLGEQNFDLLSRQAGELETAQASAENLAATKFDDQMRKAKLEPSMVREARLRIRRFPEVAIGSVNGHPCAGYQVTFHVDALMDTDKLFAFERTLFVAPHDPRIERRSARRNPNL